MTTDEEKSRLLKLLQGVEPEVSLSRSGCDLVKAFKEKIGNELEGEANMSTDDDAFENPYKVDPKLLEETERKLEVLVKQRLSRCSSTAIVESEKDPKRPWRTNSHREKLLRIENELKRHREKDSDAILPLGDNEMIDLINECQQEMHNAPPIAQNRLRDTVDAARKNLPNFKYKKVDNTTATNILPEAHTLSEEQT